MWNMNTHTIISITFDDLETIEHLNTYLFDGFAKWHLSYTSMQIKNYSIWCSQRCESMGTTRIDRSRPSSKCTVRRYMIGMLHIRLEHECARRMRLKGIGCCFLCCFLCCAVLRFRTLSCPSSRASQSSRGSEATPRFLYFRLHICIFAGDSVSKRNWLTDSGADKRTGCWLTDCLTAWQTD